MPTYTSDHPLLRNRNLEVAVAHKPAPQIEAVTVGRGQVRRYSAGPWVVLAAGRMGDQRLEWQDAFAVLPNATRNGEPVLAVGVFDGLGGLSGGAKAATEAASTLSEAIAGATTPRGILRRLNRRVLETGGGTTAAVALLPASEKLSDVLTIGDSPVYVANGGGFPSPLTPRDRTNRHRLSDYLGRDGAFGHVRRLVPPDRLLLCTDGFEDRLRDGELDRFFSAAPAELPKLLRRVLTNTAGNRGADDATVVLVARRRR